MINIQNFDDLIKEKHKYINDNPLAPQHPYRLLICGPSHSGKTNLAFNIIMKYTHFNKLYVVSKMVDSEDKYIFLQKWINKITEKLRKKTKVDELEVGYFYNNFNDLPEVDDLDENLQNLILIDDMLTERNQSKIEEYFIRSRKKNCSIIYLTQSFYRTPKLIRDNCTDFAIFDVGSKRELIEISKTVANRISYDEFVKLYRECVSNEHGFIYISTRDKSLCMHIRKNLDGLYIC